jgi:mannose/fructose/N-acetylgalactosamine-specific phosphotransferase system component IID
METWKLLFGFTVVLVMYAVVAEVINTSLSSLGGVLLFLAVVVFCVLFFLMSRFGYRMGQNLGEDMREGE